MATAQPEQELVPALQGWHRAKERADLQNRNLLQFGAGIATVLGIAAGSSGLFAVASRLQDGSELPLWAIVILGTLGLVLAIVGVVLTAYLVRAFQARRAAEHDAEDYFARLIALVPDHFLPKVE